MIGFWITIWFCKIEWTNLLFFIVSNFRLSRVNIYNQDCKGTAAASRWGRSIRIVDAQQPLLRVEGASTITHNDNNNNNRGDWDLLRIIELPTAVLVCTATRCFEQWPQRMDRERQREIPGGGGTGGAILNGNGWIHSWVEQIFIDRRGLAWRISQKKPPQKKRRQKHVLCTY